MISISLHTRPIAKDQVIHIKCGYEDNTLAASMPSRTWSKNKRVWEAPIVRLNVEYLRRNRDIYEATDEFWDMLNIYTHREGIGNGFPKDYPFKTEPFPHQRQCCQKLYPFDNQAIFADIGTGKTKMAIDMACCRYYEGKINKVLVVALVSLKDNWAREMNIHSPIPVSSHILQTTKAGQKRYQTFLQEEGGGFQCLIVGIESFSNGKAFDLCAEFVDDETMVIVDESSSIKSEGAMRTERCIQLGKIAGYRTIMTGTPITQGMIDLYSQFEFLNKDIIGIGSYYAFKSRYAVMGGYDKKAIIGYQRVEELLGAVGNNIFQVRKRDVLVDLPESTYQERHVPMSAEQKKLYATLKNTLMLEYEGNKLSVASTINLMQRFSEITGGYYSYVDQEAMKEVAIDEKVKIKYKKAFLKSNPKLKELMSLIDTMPDDEPMIIWAVGKMEIVCIAEAISKKYGEDSLVQMHGGVSREDRTKGLDKFQAGKARFLLGNQAVGGIGLNMTRAAVMVYYSNDFSLERRIQSEGRMERIGQHRSMVYIDLICTGSIDRYIVGALKDKLDFAEAIRAAFSSGGIKDMI